MNEHTKRSWTFYEKVAEKKVATKRVSYERVLQFPNNAFPKNLHHILVPKSFKERDEILHTMQEGS